MSRFAVSLTSLHYFDISVDKRLLVEDRECMMYVSEISGDLRGD